MSPIAKLLIQHLRAICAAFALVLFSPAHAQQPKTSWGAPDLQGAWTNASLTRLTRPSKDLPLILTQQEAGDLEQTLASPAASFAGTSPFQAFQNYDDVWLELGTSLASINGEFRSSWITDPTDGTIPLSPEGRRKRTQSDPRRTAGQSSANHAFDGPESRTLGERCLIGYGGTGGPVMNNVFYNNNYQIVQSPDHVVILVEMVHDARIIRLNAQHTPDTMSKWLGDSIGWYEGDTLVVQTRNVHPTQLRPVYLSKNGTLTERFTRIAPDQILYEFTVNDPDVYTQVWYGQMLLSSSNGPLYEYACHEGNYALENILSGARHQERQLYPARN